MKRNLALALLLVSFATLAFRFTETNKQPAEKEAINWITIQQAEALSKKEPRKIVIDVYTDWCGWCKKMDKSTFADEKVAKYVNKNFYAVKFNAETKEDIVFNGKTFHFNDENSVNELAIVLLQGKLGYPSTVYLDENLNTLTPVMGYYDTKKFDNLLHYFGENNHKKLSFEEFEAKKK